MNATDEVVAVQLALDVEEDSDDLSWDAWFRSLPLTPGDRTTIGERLDASDEGPAS